jgi:hypothetical protein
MVRTPESFMLSRAETLLRRQVPQHPLRRTVHAESDIYGL